ncbi:MAG: FAD-binding oxidoreductase [Bacteroidetes bacterium]|nr:FAD-binding oxidoreductase [Bacteroidota bacterium]
MSEDIFIAGSGISGLSVATYLVNAGYKVSIISSSYSPNTTSDKAAAFWFPYHISHQKECIPWCIESYWEYQKLSFNLHSGISMRKLIKVEYENVEDAKHDWQFFLPEGIYPKIIKDNHRFGEHTYSYEVMVPLIETQVFLPWLKDQLIKKGVLFERRRINSLQELSAKAKIVVNCTGLQSRVLCHDSQLIPVKGQVALLTPNNETDIFLDNEKPLYIVPRRDAIIIGGTYEENIFSQKTEENVLEEMLKKAFNVFPALQKQQFLGGWAGLRPYRHQVRVEHEPGTNIIHNYGHGGSGYTLAFGSAAVVKKIIDHWPS